MIRKYCKGAEQLHHLVVRALLAGVILLCVPSLSLAALRLVGPGKTYTTIQAAINASSNGDVIVVDPGTYRENINMKGKNVILRSQDPQDLSVVATTIIDGRNIAPCATFSGTENSTCVLEGFKITKGYGYLGGAIDGKDTNAKKTLWHHSIHVVACGDSWNFPGG